MKNLTLENLTKACGGVYFGPAGKLEQEVSSITTDSRKAEAGTLFVPIVGERVDAHRFIPQVMEAGALATLSERTLENADFPYIKVESSLQAVKDIAEFYLQQLQIPVVGITGSVGKTSTKEMISAVLSQKYNVLKTEGNFNNEIGLPLTILRIRREHEVAVVEMGISEFGEMHRIAKVAKPDICVMTNIGQCHLENLIDRDGVLRAKSEIFDFLKTDGHIVLNGNDDKLITVQEVKGVKPVFYYVEDGTAKKADLPYEITADAIENKGLRGLNANLHFPEEVCQIHEPIPGVHNVYNACAAACVGRIMGLTNEEICQGIAHAKTIAGRTNLITLGEVLVIDDCYNANPVSMKASLDVLAQADGRKIAVLGDMGELGENEREMHYDVGKYAANTGADILFCCGTLSEELAKGAQRGHTKVMYFADREKLTQTLINFVEAGDTVLVKASHFMEFPKIVKALEEALEA